MLCRGLHRWFTGFLTTFQCRRLKRQGFDPGSGRFHAGGHGNPLQYSCLENPTDRGTCWATVHMVAESWTQLKRLSMHTLWSHSEHCVSKYWTTAPRRNTGLGSYESLVTAFPSTDWYTVFFICVLLTGTSLHRYCWLINIELMASSTVTHTWIKLIYHVYWYFLSKECHSIFCI